MAEKRVYIVTVFNKEMQVVEERLVNTTHPSRAAAHVTKKRIDVIAASANQDKLIELAGRGIKVEEVDESGPQVQ